MFRNYHQDILDRAVAQQQEEEDHPVRVRRPLPEGPINPIFSASVQHSVLEMTGFPEDIVEPLIVRAAERARRRYNAALRVEDETMAGLIYMRQGQIIPNFPTSFALSMAVFTKATWHGVFNLADLYTPILDPFVLPTYADTHHHPQVHDDQTLWATCVLDGRHQRYSGSKAGEPAPMNFYSHKLNAPAVTTLNVTTLTGICLFVSGPYPAGVPDISIWREVREDAMAAITTIFNAHNYRVPLLFLADEGFRGHYPELILTHGTPAERAEFNAARLIVEQYHGRLCGMFKLMRTPFYSNMTKYAKAVKAGTMLTNLSITISPLRVEEARIPAIADQDVVEAHRASAEKHRLAQAAYRRRHQLLQIPPHEEHEPAHDLPPIEDLEPIDAVNRRVAERLPLQELRVRNFRNDHPIFPIPDNQ